jgi:hypothetical protein
MDIPLWPSDYPHYVLAKPNLAPRVLSPAECRLNEPTGAIAGAAGVIEKAGCYVVGSYKEPLGGHPGLGFHVRMRTRDGMRGARIAFSREVSNPAETRKVLVEMAQQARSQTE